MISFNWTISRELALSFVASLRRTGGKKAHQVPAQDSGLLDQNIQLIRALFVPPLSSHLMTFFIVKDLGYTCSALSSSYGCRFSRTVPPENLLFFLSCH